MAHPGGRPTKYDPAYCDQIIAHMQDGASMLSFAAEINVSRATLNVWAEQHPEFLEAVNVAKAKCAAWWEKVARTNAVTGDGNATLVVFGLKNMGRDEWHEKMHTEHSGEIGVRTIERTIVDPKNPDA